MSHRTRKRRLQRINRKIKLQEWQSIRKSQADFAFQEWKRRYKEKIDAFREALSEGSS